jgi:hypothetical protein
MDEVHKLSDPDFYTQLSKPFTTELVLAYFPNLEKIKVSLWDHYDVCACVYVYPYLLNFEGLNQCL